MRNKGQNIIAAISLLLMMGYLLYSALCLHVDAGEDVCKEVRVTLKDSLLRSFVTPAEIASMLQRSGKYPVGVNYADIKTVEIESALLKHPLIKDVQCYKTKQGVVKVDVHQRIPHYHVMSSEGNYYVDIERKIMPAMSGCAAYVPVVTGNVNKEFAKTELYDFIDFMEKDEFWHNQITQVNVVNSKQIQLIPRIGGYLIEFGSLEDYQSKLEKLETLYVEGFGKLGWKDYNVVDIQYKNQVVCRY